MAKLETLVDSKKLETLKKAFGTSSNRVILDSVEAATTKLAEIAAATTEDDSPFYGLTVGIKGSESGNSLEDIDSAAYEGAAVAVGYISERVPGADGKKVEGIKAIVMFPVPTLDQILADESGKGREFLAKIAEKELNHVFLRNLRGKETDSEFFAGLTEAPMTLEEFLTSSESTSVMDLTTFDAVWDAFKDYLKDEQAQLWKAIPKQKAIIVKAFRSAAYAKADPTTQAVEKFGLWAKMLEQLIGSAESADMDASVMKGWAENRDSLELTYREPEKLEDESVLAGISFAQ